jgi:hypothetical protein
MIVVVAAKAVCQLSCGVACLFVQRYARKPDITDGACKVTSAAKNAVKGESEELKQQQQQQHGESL